MLTAAAAIAANDPVVDAAKRTTKVAVRKTKQGTRETVGAVRTAAARVMNTENLHPSDDDISNARKKGMVWADHENWLYYTEGSNYGHTPTGEFWTKKEAEGAGYKPAPADKDKPIN